MKMLLSENFWVTKPQNCPH